MLLSPFYRWKKIKFREVKEPTQNHTASNDRSGWHKFLVLRTLQWKVFECIKWLSTYLSNKKVKECQALGYESIKALFCSRANSETRAGKDNYLPEMGFENKRLHLPVLKETPGQDFYLAVDRIEPKTGRVAPYILIQYLTILPTIDIRHFYAVSITKSTLIRID